MGEEAPSPVICTGEGPTHGGSVNVIAILFQEKKRPPKFERRNFVTDNDTFHSKVLLREFLFNNFCDCDVAECHD